LLFDRGFKGKALTQLLRQLRVNEVKPVFLKSRHQFTEPDVRLNKLLGSARAANEGSNAALKGQQILTDTYSNSALKHLHLYVMLGAAMANFCYRPMHSAAVEKDHAMQAATSKDVVSSVEAPEEEDDDGLMSDTSDGETSVSDTPVSDISECDTPVHARLQYYLEPLPMAATNIIIAGSDGQLGVRQVYKKGPVLRENVGEPKLDSAVPASIVATTTAPSPFTATPSTTGSSSSLTPSPTASPSSTTPSTVASTSSVTRSTATTSSRRSTATTSTATTSSPRSSQCTVSNLPQFTSSIDPSASPYKHGIMKRWKPPPQIGERDEELQLVMELVNRVSKEQRLYQLDSISLDQTAADVVKGYEQGHPKWHFERLYRITASDFAAAAGTNAYVSRLAMVRQKLWPRSQFITKAMQWGTETEKILFRSAIEVLCRQHGVSKPVDAETPGLWIRPDLFYLGASADGLVRFEPEGEQYVIEIKSKYWLDKDGNLKPNPTIEFDRHYYDQVQGQLAIMKLRHVYLVVEIVDQQKKVHDLKIEATEFDQEYWDGFLLPHLNHCYFNLLLPLQILQGCGAVERNSLTPSAGDKLAGAVQDRLMSTDRWARVTQDHRLLRDVVPRFSINELNSMLCYDGIGIGIKSTLSKAMQYLEGPDPKFAEEVWYSVLEDPVDSQPRHLLVFNSTGSYQTCRGQQRCYTVVLVFTVTLAIVRAFCSCKNGTSGRCGHIAGALLMLHRMQHGKEVHPVRKFVSGLKQRFPHITCGNSSANPRWEGDADLAAFLTPNTPPPSPQTPANDPTPDSAGVNF